MYPVTVYSRFEVLILPAIIAQSMIMGGGYSTGREIMQYAGRFGPSGWLAVGVIFAGFAVLSVLAFEVARLGQAYDYKTWGRLLVGPLWPLYDLLLLAMLLLVIAVMSAAMGAILQQTVGIPYGVGLAVAFVVVGFLSFKGSAFIERFKTVGSLVLYAAYLAFAFLVLTQIEPRALAVSEAVAPTHEVVTSAVQYVGYNLAIIPPVLFCLYRQTSRAQTVGAGVLAGFAMTVPFALTFVCLMRFWPEAEVVEAEVPWLEMLAAAGARSGGAEVWMGIFGVVAGWTLLETAVGGIHALVDRVERNVEDLPRVLRPRDGALRPWQRAALSVGILTVAMTLARFGIIDLIAKGYGALSWGFILLVALPLLTVGVGRILLSSGEGEGPGPRAESGST